MPAKSISGSDKTYPGSSIRVKPAAFKTVTFSGAEMKDKIQGKPQNLAGKTPPGNDRDLTRELLGNTKMFARSATRSIDGTIRRTTSYDGIFVEPVWTTVAGVRDSDSGYEDVADVKI